MNIETHKAGVKLQKEIQRLTMHLHTLSEYGMDYLLFAQKIDTDRNGQPLFLSTTITAEKDCLPLKFEEIRTMYIDRVREMIAQLEAEFAAL